MDAALARIIRRAGRMMLEYQSPKVFDKGHHADFVTEADVAVQQFVLEELARAFPGARFLAEEEEKHVLTDALTFIVDPIDGTTNYFRHRRCSMVSLGAVEGKIPVFGALYDPYRDELYHAERGHGAYLGDTRLHVSDQPLERAIVGFGTSPYYPELFGVTGRTMRELLPLIADFRRTGSSCVELCDVASGRSDAHFEWRLQPWDYCAGTLLVEEAGGKCGGMLGGEVVFDQGMPHLAANPRGVEALQALLTRIWQEEQQFHKGETQSSH